MKKLRATGTALLLLVALSGCGASADILNGSDSFDDRLEALDAVYKQGQTARNSMTKLGLVVDETSCDSSWVTSGAKDAEDDMGRREDKPFQELRHLSFINGCMDRPNKLPATNAPLLPGQSATPTVTSPATPASPV